MKTYSVIVEVPSEFAEENSGSPVACRTSQYASLEEARELGPIDIWTGFIEVADIEEYFDENPYAFSIVYVFEGGQL